MPDVERANHRTPLRVTSRPKAGRIGLSTRHGRGKPQGAPARQIMNGPEPKDAELVDDAPQWPQLPPPDAQPVPRAAAQGSGWIDFALSLIERRPLASAGAIFLMLALIHLLLLNIAGVASFLFVGDEFFLAAGSNAVEVVLLALIAHTVVLPTLLGQACLRAYDDLRPALALDDDQFARTRATLADPFSLWRLGFGLFWAVILTPVFGDLFRASVPGEAWGAALLTLWLYVRIALIFGLLGAGITYVAMLHHRFSRATGPHLRIDLFDRTPLEPIAHFARMSALLLIIPLALAGPAVAQPEAALASAVLFLVGLLLVVLAIAAAMWGARRAIRDAKKHALAELQTYARELWRRAYADGRITEAVAIPALGAMLTTRAEIARLGDWPGGRSIFAHVCALALIPLLTWFGGQLATLLLQAIAA